MLAVPGSVPGELEFEGDQDWIAFEAVEGNRFSLEVVLDSLLDSVLRLYDLDGETLLEMNDNIDITTGQYGSRIEWEVPRTGTYYASVRGFADRRVGTYQLDVTLLEDDHGNHAATATPVAVPSTAAGEIEMPGDVDWFSLQATAEQLCRLETTLGDLTDSVLKLYDVDGTTVLAENDDFDGQPQSRIDWQAPAAGTYYVEVATYGQTMTGTYELVLSEREGVPPEGSLVFPAAGTIVTADPGYVDIAWTDTGSGIDPDTIGPTDITVTGVTITEAAETPPGSGVWRYTYTGSLSVGPVEVVLGGARVADLDANWNDRTMERFTFGEIDLGDAPDPSYPTLSASGGAWHPINGPTLGTNRDFEADGQPTSSADGDDTTGMPDDEEGVTFGSTIMVGQLNAGVTVNVQNAPSGAKLDAWIDFNADRSWGGPFEQIADTVAVVNGDNTISFDVPSWAVDGTTYARFRLSTAGGLGPDGRYHRLT